ncbi:UbiA family prenyltransferase [Candidatus Micrarchaeota archaeon]|nr:UbiA family prenyltransferase [Candidatus Micrarchaeota archaeon]
MAAAAVFIGLSVAIRGIAFPFALLLGMFSAFVICGAGQAINDFYDAEVDKKLNPKKPIPAGRASAKGARNFAIALFAIGIAVSYFINTDAFIIALFYSALLYAYSAKMQGHKYIGNWVVAGGTAITLIYGAAIAGNYSVVIYLAFAALLANGAREIIKDMQDIGGDIGRKRTLPMMLPEKIVRYIVFLLYGTAIAIGFFVWAMGMLQGIFYLIFMALASVAFYYSFDRLVRGKTGEAQKYSKYAMGIALLAFVAGVF